MKRGLFVVILLALVVGAYITKVAGWPIVAIGLGGIAAAILYTGGPYPLGYHGWGDVFVFLFFGVIAVSGSTYVQLGFVPSLAWFACVPIGGLATNILVVNNLRDRHTDRLVHKKTLAVRFGKRAALAQYAIQATLSYIVPPLLLLSHKLSAWTLLPLVSAPLALKAWSRLRDEEGKSLNGVLVASAKLVFIFGGLFALGLFLPHWIG